MKKATDVASPVGQSLSVDPYRNDVMCPARPKMRKNGNGKKGKIERKILYTMLDGQLNFLAPKSFFFPPNNRPTTNNRSMVYCLSA